MRTNPHLPCRKSIRLKGYDYSREGAYFITICCQDMKHRLGKVIKGAMILNEFGQIAHDEWASLKIRYPHFEFDVFQIMPNHMHGIVVIGGPTLAVGRSHASHEIIPSIDFQNIDHRLIDDLDHPMDDRATVKVARAEEKNASIPDVMGAYKSIVSNRCLEIYKSLGKIMGKFWQRSYNDKIIRDERAFQNISNYIVNNPKKWSEDRFY